MLGYYTIIKMASVNLHPQFSSETMVIWIPKTVSCQLYSGPCVLSPSIILLLHRHYTSKMYNKFADRHYFALLLLPSYTQSVFQFTMLFYVKFPSLMMMVMVAMNTQKNIKNFHTTFTFASLHVNGIHVETIWVPAYTHTWDCYCFITGKCENGKYNAIAFRQRAEKGNSLKK